MARRRGSGDWVPCDEYGNGVQVQAAAGSAVGPLTGFLLVRHGLTSDQGVPPLDEPQVAVVEPTDDISVERVIGQVDMRRVDVGEHDVLVAMRIVKVVFDEDDNVFASFEDDLFAGDDANSPFLWQRYVYLTSGTPSIAAAYIGNDLLWSHLDVQVGRLLERSEALMMLLQARPVAAAVATDVSVQPFLRSWAVAIH